MEYNLYCILDIKAETYGRPIIENNDDTAMRAFQTAVREPGTAYNTNPEDYFLVRIGHYDDNDATITGEAPQRIWSAFEALKALENRNKMLNQQDLAALLTKSEDN